MGKQAKGKLQAMEWILYYTPPACSNTTLKLGTWLERRGSISVAMGKGLATGFHNVVVITAMELADGGG